MKKAEKDLIAALKKFYGKDNAKLQKVVKMMHSTGELSDEAFDELMGKQLPDSTSKEDKNYRAKTVRPKKRPNKINDDPSDYWYGYEMEWTTAGCGEGYSPVGDKPVYSKEKIKADKAKYRADKKKQREEEEAENERRRMARSGCYGSNFGSYC